MSDNVIDFQNAKAQLDNEKALIEKRRAAIAKLKNYRGEVVSKNSIRSLLPNVKVGEIFWVDIDNAAYVVTTVEGAKVTIKSLDEMASLSTGITVYEMNKKIVSQEPLFDWKNGEDKLKEKLDDWLLTGNHNQYYLLYGRDIHYLTLFANLRTPLVSGTNLLNSLKSALSNVGDLISIDFDTQESGEKCLEIWIRTAESAAELLYLFPYDQGIVYI